MDGLSLGSAPADLVLLRNFAIALCLGALVGVDRERKAASAQLSEGCARMC